MQERVEAINDGLRELAIAILTFAVEDYQALIQGQKPYLITANKPSKRCNLEELQSFFNSEWADILCGVCNIYTNDILKRLMSQKETL